MARLDLHFGDNLPILRSLPSGSIDLIYIDPPFNTGRIQSRDQIAVVRDAQGPKAGFHGLRYRHIKIGSKEYPDLFDDYLTFLEPRLVEAHRLLRPDGSLFFHIDYREVHYCKVLLDLIFGRDSFINEIVWAYDYGARSRSRWPTKHDNILWYARNPADYQFHLAQCDRIPYMAPDLVGEEKAARGKTPTDTWWHTIVSPNGREKTGYPNQKPRGILDRIVKVHSRRGDQLLDFFAGSGSFGESAVAFGRNCILIDDHIEAMQVMARRFIRRRVAWHGWNPKPNRTRSLKDSRLLVAAPPNPSTDPTPVPAPDPG